jgi:hypothetical protein
MIDLEEQWNLITEAWDWLNIEQILTERVPLDRRWQVDVLIERMRCMDRAFEEKAYLEALVLAEMDGDEEAIADLNELLGFRKKERQHGHREIKKEESRPANKKPQRRTLASSGRSRSG